MQCIQFGPRCNPTTIRREESPSVSWTMERRAEPERLVAFVSDDNSSVTMADDRPWRDRVRSGHSQRRRHHNWNEADSADCLVCGVSRPFGALDPQGIHEIILRWGSIFLRASLRDPRRWSRSRQGVHGPRRVETRWPSEHWSGMRWKLMLSDVLLSFSFPTRRQKVRRSRGGRLVAGRHPLHASERLAAFRRFDAARIARAGPARQVPHPVLHVDRLRESTQEIPRPQSGQTRFARGMRRQEERPHSRPCDCRPTRLDYCDQ